MDFIKKHYEKIILSVVLLGLVAALLGLPFLIASDHARTEEIEQTIIKTSSEPLPPLDLTQQSNVAERLESPPSYDFSTTNKLFNPVEWKKAANGTLIKIKNGNEIVEGAVITKITPLYFMVTLDSVETNEFGARYVISVERQGAPNPMMRRKREHYVSIGDKNEAFTLLSAKGVPENPDQLVLKLADSGETVTISKNKPFQRVDAYTADLKYDLEKKVFLARREGSVISFGGEEYIIVAIHPNEVILSAASNQKRTTLRYTP
jgi:hypothetical protein